MGRDRPYPMTVKSEPIPLCLHKVSSSVEPGPTSSTSRPTATSSCVPATNRSSSRSARPSSRPSRSILHATGEVQAADHLSNAVFHAHRLRGQKCRRNRRGTLSITRPSPGRRDAFAQVFINAEWPLQYLRKSRIKRISSVKQQFRSGLLKTRCLTLSQPGV
jgi:hypothetical protein